MAAFSIVHDNALQQLVWSEKLWLKVYTVTDYGTYLRKRWNVHYRGNL